MELQSPAPVQVEHVTIQPSRASDKAWELYDNCLSLVACGHLGVLCRYWLGYCCSNSWKGSIICCPFHDLPANMLGCLIMGLLCDGATSAKQLVPPGAGNELSAEARKEVDTVAAMPLTTAPGLAKGRLGCMLLGLRTGFCGSFTTYASWSNAMVLLLDDGEIGDAFSGFLFGLLLSVSSYRAGQQAGLFLSSLSTAGVDRAVASVADWSHAHAMLVRVLLSLTLLGAFAGEAVALALINDPLDPSTLLILCLFFAPFGVLGRWQLAKLNPKIPFFPLGTFAANMLACVVDAVVDVINIYYTGNWTKAFMTGVATGFSGSLSTVSTFIVEILDKTDPIRVPGKELATWRRSGPFYAIVSLFIGAVVPVALSGWARWTN